MRWNRLGRVTDRIDDVIVAAYGLIAAGAAWRHRRSLLRLRLTVLLFALAFVCFLAMLIFDTLRKLSTLEDSLKLMAEAMILCGLLAADPADWTRNTEEGGRRKRGRAEGTVEEEEYQ